MSRHCNPRRNFRKQLIRHIPLIVLVALIVFVWWSARAADTLGRSAQSYSGLLEVSTRAGVPQERLSGTGMEISFNPSLHIPNWVAWELTADEADGAEPRSNKFTPDPRTNASAQTSDYRNSGYDRGHMAPAGDMKWSPESMAESFYMTNICPQVHSLNAGAWKALEESCRRWARRDSAIIIVCGPVRTDSYIERIGDTGVAVPAEFFKVVIAPYAVPPRGIGFIMPNGYVDGGMQTTVCSIDEVEARTGHDFFSSLPDSIENVIETQHDLNQWNKLR